MEDRESLDAIPRLVRPSREMAIEVAEAFFRRSLRVDMQTVCERLGVGRTTLYRWVGGREQLIAEVIARLTDLTWTQTREQGNGKGIDAAVDSIGVFMAKTSTYPPLREFAQREPQLALRILLSARGPVAAQLKAGLESVLAKRLPDFDPEANQDLVDTMVQIGTALQWAPIVIDEQPSIERALRLMGGLLQNYERGRTTATK